MSFALLIKRLGIFQTAHGSSKTVSRSLSVTPLPPYDTMSGLDGSTPVQLHEVRIDGNDNTHTEFIARELEGATHAQTFDELTKELAIGLNVRSPLQWLISLSTCSVCWCYRGLGELCAVFV